MIRPPVFVLRMGIVVGVATLGLATCGNALAQAQNPPPQNPPAQSSPAQNPPPAKSTPPTETDIGRVTTGAGQGEKVVVPNATIDRADAIAEK
ncbi:MAG TPA: hypothetical protein VHS76_09330 [Steroidobacteraceae bacterium]|nr:hypothetical protein [Steroidobacteraceae bacterium]